MYEAMINRIDFVVTQGKVPQELKQHQGFSKWISNMTSRNHDTIIQVIFLLDIVHKLNFLKSLLFLFYFILFYFYTDFN